MMWTACNCYTAALEEWRSQE